MPASLLVTYDLRGRDETSADYEQLISAIKSYGYYAKLMLSTWVVVTDESARTVLDHLTQYLDSNDRIFVGPVVKPAAWRNLMATDEWMQDRP